VNRDAAELLSILCLARLGPCHRGRAWELAEGRMDWQAFFDLAEQNSAQVLASRRIRELGLDTLVPSALAVRASEWHGRAAKIRESGERRRGSIARILSKAEAAGIEVILLKGGLLGPVVYGDPAYKKMNDIDVLVRFEDAARMASILREADFSSVGGLLGKLEIDRESHHSPPFVSPDLSCVIGLHWGLASPLSIWKPDTAGIWERREPVEAFGVRAYRMSWEDNLLHLCIHLPFYKTGVRELADVYNLCLNAEIDWERFAALVRLWKAADAAYRVLSLAGAVMPFGAPPALLAELERQARPFTVRDTQARVLQGATLVAHRSTHIARIEKAFSVFKLSGCYPERVGAWAKTWQLTFWPDERELTRIFAARGKLTPLGRARARCLAPARCWGALARDYGHVAVAAITVANIGTILKETARRPFVAPKPSIRLHPAARLLETLE
jgi:hypothetical protein